MHRRLALLAALVLAALAAAGPASAAVTQGGPWAPDVRSIATLDADTWFTATDRGLFRTDDAGVTWQAVTRFPAAAGADPAPADFLPGVAASVGTRVYAIDANRTVGVSSDSGATWTFHEHRGDWWGLVALVADPSDADHLILITNDRGQLVTTDGGLTWRRSVFPFDDDIRHLDNIQVLANGDVIGINGWRPGHADYLVSTDGGRIWSTVRTVDGITDLIGIVETSPGRLVAIGLTGDPCDSFEPQDALGLLVPRYEMKVMIQVDGGLWTPGGTLCSRVGVIQSGDWHGLIGHGDTVAFISGAPTVEVSTDGGLSFVAPAPEKPPFLQMTRGFASPSAGALVVAGNTGVMRITSDAVQPRSVGVQSYIGLTGLAVAPGEPDSMLVSLGERGIFRSGDGGATWSPTADQVAPQAWASSTVQPPTFADAQEAAFAIDAPGSTFGTNGTRIFTTRDGAESWHLAQAIDGWEPGGPVAYAGLSGAYLPINLPYVGDLADTNRCAILVADRRFTVYDARPIGGADVDARCTKLAAVASDPSDSQHLIAIGEYIDGSTGMMLARRFYRSADGGLTWKSPTGLGAAFPTAMWLPRLHVAYTGSHVYIWQARSSMLCTSTNDGATFSCKKGAFATTPGGPGWFADGYLSSFEPQADGSIVASVVNPADWTDPNDALPDSDVETFLARSVDGGVTWAVADPTDSVAITDVVDIAAQAAARSSARRAATGSRRLVLASAGVFRRRVAFKRAARGRATAVGRIVVSRKGRATVRVRCPRGKRCTGYLRVLSTGRFASTRTPFDVVGTRTVVVRIAKAKVGVLALGARIPVRVAIDRTVGGAGSYRTTARVRR